MKEGERLEDGKEQENKNCAGPDGAFRGEQRSVQAGDRGDGKSVCRSCPPAGILSDGKSFCRQQFRQKQRPLGSERQPENMGSPLFQDTRNGMETGFTIPVWL